MTLTRPLITGRRFMVSSGHWLATMAAYEILTAGGNAVDAGCAAGMVLGVVQPDIVNVAGVAPIMIRLAETGQILTIAGLGHWPASLPEGHFATAHRGTIPPGVQRCVVPAAPDAWITALKLHGTMTFSEVASAAIRHARDGFFVYPLLADSLAAHEADYRRWPSSKDVFYPHDRMPAEGELFVQSDLAATLDHMAMAETRARGDRLAGLEAARAAFYAGDIARTITGYVAEQGGFLSMADMRDFRSRLEPAVTMTWRGMQLSVCGPWTQGPVLLHALRLLEGHDLAAMGHNSPEMIHTVVEALKWAFADREAHYGDPAHCDVPLDAILSDANVTAQRARIDPAQAMPDMPMSLLPAAGPHPPVPQGDAPQGDPDTSYVCVVDRAGNSFSATPSDGSWSVPMVPGTGLVPSTRGSQSRPYSGHPSSARAGKRPRLTPNPALLVHGDAVTPFGTPGGDVQSQAMLQFLLNRHVFGMNPQEALDAPRFATYSFPSSFAPFTAYPGLLKLEAGIAPETAQVLARRGHRIAAWPRHSWLAGGVCAITARPAAGEYQGAADPRRPSYAAGS